MTKYILHGGLTREISPDNDSFFQEMTGNLPAGANFLIINFARDDWNEVAGPHIETVKKANPNLNIVVSEEENIVNQIKSAAGIYLVGGETAKLMQALSKIPNIEKLFEGKVIGGSSAGAYALCKYYYESDDESIGEGLGILSLKIVCHFESSREDRVKRLMENGEDLPVIVLPDFKWQVFYK